VPEVTIGRSLAALTQFRYPTIFVEGPRGTSKSRGILTVLLRRLFKYPGARLIIGRQFRSDLTKTILATLEEEVFPAFGLSVPGGAHRENRSEYRLANGSLIFPIGIDQGVGALSLGATFAYLAEITEKGMREETVTDIAGALRWMRSPEHPELPDYTQMILDGNPVAPDHFANRMAVDCPPSIREVRTREDYERLQAYNYAEIPDPIRRWKRIVTKHQDNPGYWDHDAWGYWPLGRNYITLQLEGLKGFKRSRWLDGLWKAAEGAVYPEFNDVQRDAQAGRPALHVQRDQAQRHRAHDRPADARLRPRRSSPHRPPQPGGDRPAGGDGAHAAHDLGQDGTRCSRCSGAARTRSGGSRRGGTCATRAGR
jgi:hypothetical protein